MDDDRSAARQKAACDLAERANTPEQFEAAHAAMRAAFPSLSRVYPCDCEACRRAAETDAGAHRRERPMRGAR